MADAHLIHCSNHKWLTVYYQRVMGAPSKIRRLASDSHVRNLESDQWRSHFTPRVKQACDATYVGLVKELGYAPD